MALVDKSREAPETSVARRGDIKNIGPRVAPRPPGVVLAAQDPSAFGEGAIRPTATTTGRRLALARWLTRPDNPVTTRVIVNRLWHHHFGRGIVATPSDLGVRGEPPSHPELLDWLATELVAQGWRLKPIHRLMVTSATYRQASSLPPVLEPASDRPRTPRTLAALADEPAEDGGRGDPRRDAGPRGRPQPEVRRAGPPGADGEGSRGPDLHHRREGRPLARGRRPSRAPSGGRSTSTASGTSATPLFDAFDAPDSQTACPQCGPRAPTPSRP